MDEILYNSIVKYFSSLKEVGYVSYDDMQSLLFLSAVQEFVYKDFRGFITENDYREIERALYKVFGTSCLVPYPEYCNNNSMNKLHLGDISEISYRIHRDNSIVKAVKQLQKTGIIKTQHECQEEIVPEIMTGNECKHHHYESANSYVAIHHHCHHGHHGGPHPPHHPNKPPYPPQGGDFEDFPIGGCGCNDIDATVEDEELVLG